MNLLAWLLTIRKSGDRFNLYCSIFFPSNIIGSLQVLFLGRPEIQLDLCIFVRTLRFSLFLANGDYTLHGYSNHLCCCGALLVVLVHLSRNKRNRLVPLPTN